MSARHALIVCNELSYFRAHREGLMNHLLKGGWRVSVACGGSASDEGPERPADWPSAVTFHPLKLDRHRLSPVADARLLVELRRIIGAEQPSVVHAITIKPVTWIALLASALPSSIGFVLTLPGLGKVFEEQPGRLVALRKRLVSFVVGRLLRSGKGLTTVENEADRERLIEALGVAPDAIVTICGTGLDRMVFNTKNRRPIAPEGEPIRVLMASRLIGEKGVDTYLEAARRSADADLPLHFTLAGLPDPTNPDSLASELLERAAAQPNVDLVGAVPVNYMPDLLRQHDVVCLPTRLREGFPRSLLEAAACGCALVASDQPAIRQIVREGETGLLIDPPSTDRLFAALETLAGDRDYLRALAAGAARLADALPIGTAEVGAAFDDVYRKASRVTADGAAA